MSNAIPRQVIDSMRNSVDVVLNYQGIDCSLFIPTSTSSNEAEMLDAYSLPSDKTFIEYTTKVFIVWKPNIRRLKKLGLFEEGSLPLIGKFGRKATPVTGSNAGIEIDVDIIQGSWFRTSIEYVYGNTSDVTDFEIVDIVPPQVHDAVIWKEYIVAPMRLQK